MKNFFSKKAMRVVLILVIVLAVILLSRLIMGGGNVVTGSVRFITSPMEKGLGWFVDRLEGIYDYMYRYDELKAENEELKARIKQMEAEVRQSEATNKENAVLRELLNLSELHPQFTYDIAAITSWNSSTWSSSFVINRGTRSGIELFDPVITEEGDLVGQVVEVTGTSAVVQTIIDSAASVGAYISRTGITAVAEGDYFMMQDGNLKLSYMPDGTEVLNGDTVLTSGVGEIFPPDLVIGTIVSVTTDESGFTVYGIIKPGVELSSLTHVFIIKDYDYTTD
ncbi:MAG: rod shape-determining protein MreC [Clostridiales bacterium]|mgnify:FL=1|nr:rod shape-determining protein MreC [Clostridiales bacterium]